MARWAALALLLLGLLGALAQEYDRKPTAHPKKHAPGDDFDLGDALVGGGNGDDFDLGDAVGGGGNDEPKQPYPPKPKPDPNPRQPGSSGGFSDADLDGIGNKGEGTRGGADSPGNPRDDGEQQQADSPGVISGIVGSIMVAVVGAISSFIAYQKKKLCFKENEQGDINMENQQDKQSMPPAQRTLLEKV